MANQYKNKVVLADGTVLVDLTQDDVTAADVLYGVKFHLPSGASGVGQCTYDADTSDADATASEILNGKTAYKNGSKVTGSMPNIGGQTGGVSDVGTPVQISQGYHDGSGRIGIDSVEAQKLIPGNIKSGVMILGVTGSYSGEGVSAQSKNVTPYLTEKTYLPDSGYDYLSQVKVAEITITETDNAAGGVTVVIGAVDPDA